MRRIISLLTVAAVMTAMLAFAAPAFAANSCQPPDTASTTVSCDIDYNSDGKIDESKDFSSWEEHSEYMGIAGGESFCEEKTVCKPLNTV